ncbi:MAG: hypothetical protein JSW47_17940 [Phycisphaerales bacterium]|nr:MAG: hypothetical protein JSW47_17940 [Phycisphaerales bacterium]
MSNSNNLNDGPWRDLYNVVSKRRDTLKKWNARHVTIYKYLGYCFGVAMPLLAALVTYLSTAPGEIPIYYASITGLILTFLTVLNQVLKPSQRFLSAVQLSHELEEFETDFDIDLRGLSRRDPQNLEEIYTVLRRRNRQLSAIGEAMARGTLSTSMPETQNTKSIPMELQEPHNQALNPTGNRPAS